MMTDGSKGGNYVGADGVPILETVSSLLGDACDGNCYSADCVHEWELNLQHDSKHGNEMVGRSWSLCYSGQPLRSDADSVAAAAAVAGCSDSSSPDTDCSSVSGMWEWKRMPMIQMARILILSFDPRM